MALKKLKRRRIKDQRKVRVQQLKSGQYIITLPIKIAIEWLDVRKGDRIEFEPYKGRICISKVEVDHI